MEPATGSGGPARVLAGGGSVSAASVGSAAAGDAPIRLVCLELAGILVTTDGVRESVGSALRAAGLTESDIRAVGPLDRDAGPVPLAALRRAVGESTPVGSALKAFDAAVLRATEQGLVGPLPEAEQALRALRSGGVEVCLTSAYPDRVLSAVVERLGWSGLVDPTPRVDGLRGPPYPDQILAAVLRTGVDDVHQVAVVGVAADELVAGYRAGAGVVVGLLAPGVDPSGLDGAPQSRVLASIAELPRLLGRRPGPATVEPSRPARAAPAPAGPATAAILDVADLTICYGSYRAVNGIGLQVRRGEIFGLLGPNGAGKTSTLSAVEGLLKPRAGTISVDGVDALRHPIEARALMGVQLQATSFPTSLTLKQIVQLYAGLYGVAMTGGEISAVLAEIGLDEEMGREFKQLSGGQKQRLSLQIAVIHAPSLLLLDEPTAGLDPQARRQLWSRIEHLRRDGGSILLTTHSMEEAQAVCDRVAIMDQGRILTSGSPAELIAAHRRDPRVTAVAHGDVTLDDVFVGLTGSQVRD